MPREWRATVRACSMQRGQDSTVRTFRPWSGRAALSVGIVRSGVTCLPPSEAESQRAGREAPFGRERRNSFGLHERRGAPSGASGEARHSCSQGAGHGSDPTEGVVIG